MEVELHSSSFFLLYFFIVRSSNCWCFPQSSMSSDNNIPHERRDTTNLSLFRLHPLCNATPDASSAFLSTYLLSHPTLLPLLGCYTAPHINNLIFQECAKGTPPPDNRHFWLQRSTTFNTTTPCHCLDR